MQSSGVQQNPGKFFKVTCMPQRTHLAVIRGEVKGNLVGWTTLVVGYPYDAVDEDEQTK